MEALINKSITSLNGATTIAATKSAFVKFLTGLKDIDLENSNLNAELSEQRAKIHDLETKIQDLLEEKADMIKSMEYNASAIQGLESSLSSRNATSSVAVSDQTNKDAQIAQMEKTIANLEKKIDATEAYERRDSIIISGAIPPATEGREENSVKVVVDTINKKLGAISIGPNDISVAHRLQAKPTVPGSTPRPPNIYVKLVRRDLKKQLITASKQQNRNSERIFINDSLTPQRNAVFRTLQKIKREHDVVKGC